MHERVHVALGTNIDREQSLKKALAALHERFGALTVSTLYECPAIGFDGDPFYNCVIAFDSDESVDQVHDALHAIEDQCGRDRREPRFAPRTLDLDLLLFGDRILRTGDLVLPRPDIDRLAFVLAPLAELAGERQHPVHNESFTSLWARFDGIGADDLVPVDPHGRIDPALLT